MDNEYYEKKGFNNSKIEIIINTKFKKITENDWGDDDYEYDDEMLSNFSPDIEEAFHRAIHKYLEEHLIENEELEGYIMQELGDNSEIPKEFKEFSQLGNIGISLTQTKIEKHYASVLLPEQEIKNE